MKKASFMFSILLVLLGLFSSFSAEATAEEVVITGAEVYARIELFMDQNPHIRDRDLVYPGDVVSFNGIDHVIQKGVCLWDLAYLMLEFEKYSALADFVTKKPSTQAGLVAGKPNSGWLGLFPFLLLFVLLSLFIYYLIWGHRKNKIVEVAEVVEVSVLEKVVPETVAAESKSNYNEIIKARFDSWIANKPFGIFGYSPDFDQAAIAGGLVDESSSALSPIVKISLERLLMIRSNAASIIPVSLYCGEFSFGAKASKGTSQGTLSLYSGVIAWAVLRQNGVTDYYTLLGNGKFVLPSGWATVSLGANLSLSSSVLKGEEVESFKEEWTGNSAETYRL